ncbi:solute symporter family protein [Saccharomonospora halophila]|uniref:solute symporter family protein n=1 Tax=Saccharomonospora halophila TaxID=129922 RepID=UPI00039AEE0C|nr:cation acetate symporter [Saccharomonospora halophila]
MNFYSAIIFSVLVGLTLVITYVAARRGKSAADHFVADGQLTGRQNGLAIAGDYVSAASFLGVTGAIALSGFTGFYLAVFVPVAYVLALLLVAEPLRNLGRFTLADVLAIRFEGRSVRAVMAGSTLIVSTLYLVAQFVGAALLVRLLFGIDYTVAVLVIGGLTTVYTMLGGMLATSWIQIVKTTLMLACAVTLFVLVLVEYGGNPLGVFQDALETFGSGAVGPDPESGMAGFDQLSQVFGLVLGVLGLPHVMIRFFTVPDARAARSSAITAIWVFTAFYLMIPVIGYGAALLVGRDAITAQNSAGNLAVAQLAETVGGGALLALVSAVAFVTILAVLSGLVIAASGAIAHDLYAQVIKRGSVSPRAQLVSARIATFATCAVGVSLALAAADQNVAFLASLAFAVAASANLPALLLTIYWRRMTARAVLWGMGVGLVSSMGIILLSPAVLGSSAVLGFSNPALVTVPLSLLVSIAVAVAAPTRGAEAGRDRAVFRMLRTKAVTGRGDVEDGGQPEGVR